MGSPRTKFERTLTRGSTQCDSFRLSRAALALNNFDAGAARRASALASHSWRTFVVEWSGCPQMTQIRHGTLHEPWSLVVDMQDVAVGILEPGGLELSSNVDVAFAPESGRVIMFERNTGLLKITHDGVHFFADSPSCGRGLVAPGKLRLVDDDCRIAASQRDNAGPFCTGG